MTIRIFHILLVAVALVSVSCKEGVKSGTPVSSFAGVASIEVQSPTSVKIIWDKSQQITRYEVYANYQSEAVAEQVFATAIIDGLTAEESYRFKVLGYHENGKVFGGSREYGITTWPTFSGIVSAALDENNNVLVTWDYPYQAEFLVYAVKGEEPTAANTNNWEDVTVSASNQQQITLNDLDNSADYFITVHAKFSDDEFNRPAKALQVRTISTIPEPSFSLSSITIGNLPFLSVSPVVNGLFQNTSYTSRVSKDGNFLSDPLVGTGTLLFTNTGGASTPGLIDDIKLEVAYNDGTTEETYSFLNLSTYVKDQENFIDVPPISGAGTTLDGPTYFGDAMASGDFNCDGYDDLAVGLSQVAMAEYGVSNPGAGAVIVYYSKKEPFPSTLFKLNTDVAPSPDPAVPGEDPLIITFDDLLTDAAFGFSMDGGGNINGDTLGGKPCEDLIVGAPRQGAGQDGEAFVFFGSRAGLTSSAHISNLFENVESCDGLLEESTCSPVRLWPDHSLWPSGTLGGAFTPIPNTGSDRFGHSVAFVGDLNSDGFDDIAVGAPYGDWDGVANPGSPGETQYVRDVGYVALYFGSRYGIGYETPLAPGIPNSGDARFRWLKVFPPVVESGMNFGWSIDGGADVDGYFPVYNSNGDYYGGSDMVVGAPGFSYSNPFANSVAMDGSKGLFPFNGGWTRGAGNGNNYGMATSEFGIPQGTGDTGIAFLYFGRGSLNDPGASVDEPFRQTYWNCGSRGMASATEHYSCLGSKLNVRWIAPREATASGFGTSVALLGDPAHYDKTKTALANFSDPNEDGYAELVVSANAGDSSALANTGQLWQFFGNKGRLYEGGDFNGIAIGGDATATGEWRDNSANCVDFTNSALAANQRNCAPTVIRPNSVPAGARMGLTAESMEAGDLTGDNIKDLVVGAHNDNITGTASGAIYAFVGTPGKGLTTVYKKLYNSSGNDNDNLGYSVAIGNFDGDTNGAFVQLDDVAAGALNSEQFGEGAGAVSLFLSKGSVLPAVVGNADITLQNTQGSSQNFGHHLTRIIGDINGDGYDDAVGRLASVDESGATVVDAVVYFGSTIGLVTHTFCKNNLSRVFLDGQEDLSLCYPTLSPPVGVTKTSVRLPQLIQKPLNLGNLWAEFGAAAGDVNGDGFGDVYFGDVDNSIVLYYGSGGGLVANSQPKWRPAPGEPQLVTFSLAPTGMQTTGQCVNCTTFIYTKNNLLKHGDFNGDGYSDLLIGDPRQGSAPMNTTTPNLPPGGGYVPNTVASGAGWQCDPAVSQYATACSSGQTIDNHGAVYIIYGSSLGLQTPSVKGTHAEGTDFSFADATTIANAYGSETDPAKEACTGDVVKNCTAQMLRNPVFVNINFGFNQLGHGFGASLVVMDWNNDGVDDILVSAPRFEDLVCYDVSDPTDPSYRRDYGRIYMFKGSASGLIAGEESDYFMNYNNSQSCPSILSDASYDDLATGVQALGSPTTRVLMPQIVNNNDVSREFGIKMTVAGDINNDGAEDLLVSVADEAESNGDNRGLHYVYYGPLCGADNEPALLAYTQNENNLNYQLSSSDPSDIAVLSSINFGSDCGIGGSPKPAMQKFVVRNSVDGNRYGQSVLGGRKDQADVNKDGYDDIVVGTHLWSPGGSSLTNVGHGVIYFGGQRGLYTNDIPDTTVVADSQGNLKPYSIEPKYQYQNMRLFDYEMSGGDVNNDGSFDFTIPTQELDTDGTVKGINIGGFIIFY